MSADKTSDQPSSPVTAARGPLLFGLIVILLAFGGAGLWASTAPISSGAIASGEIVVLSNRKTVQHLEGGIISDILVREGDAVAAGQPLLVLDALQAQASLDLLQGQLHALEAQEARLIAERDGEENLAFGISFAGYTDNPKLLEIVEGQTGVFEARRVAIDSQLAIFDQRVVEYQQQIEGLEAQVKSEETQLELIEEELKGVRILFEKGIERKPRLLALQRNMAEIQGIRGQHLSDIARVRQSIGETKLEAIDLKNRFLNGVVTELRDVQTKIADLEERTLAARDVLTRTKILAPQAGTVVNMQFHTKGGVVPPRQPILDIVPVDDELVVTARVRPEDIDSVRVGLGAEVRLTAFSMRSTPTLTGEVIHISADRLISEYTGEPYFEARVRIDKSMLDDLENVDLYPGMPAEVMIVMGERTALQLAIDPIWSSMRRSFREN